MQQNLMFQRILNDLDLDIHKYRVLKLEADGVWIKRVSDNKREKVRY
ncbi:hypothetical protein ACSW9O_15835 (plasmid) [Clostridium perfringens]